MTQKQITKIILKKRRIKLDLYSVDPYCYWCEKRFMSFREATLEHIFPKSKGGKNTKGNLTLACKACNLKKGNRIISKYDQELEEAQKLVKMISMYTYFQMPTLFKRILTMLKI